MPRTTCLTGSIRTKTSKEAEIQYNTIMAWWVPMPLSICKRYPKSGFTYQFTPRWGHWISYKCCTKDHHKYKFFAYNLNTSNPKSKTEVVHGIYPANHLRWYSSTMHVDLTSENLHWLKKNGLIAPIYWLRWQSQMHCQWLLLLLNYLSFHPYGFFIPTAS